MSCCLGVLGIFGGGELKGSRGGLWLGEGNKVCDGSLAKIVLRDSCIFFFSSCNELMPFSIPALSPVSSLLFLSMSALSSASLVDFFI